MRGRRKGAPKTGGRKAGTPNKTTAEIREFARSYGRRAIRQLARLAFHGESGMVQVMAIKELLNRGFGLAARSAPDAPGPHRVTIVMCENEDAPGEPLPARDLFADLPRRHYPSLPPPLGKPQD